MSRLKKINITVVDYQMSNIFSVKNIFAQLGVELKLSAEANDIRQADALIIPGVGAFGAAMANLQQLQLIAPIKEFIATGKPFLGICLGLQLLFSKSYEFGIHEGLGIIPGDVVKFDTDKNGHLLKTPNIGWNKIITHNAWAKTPLQDLKNETFVYFVHSYYVKPIDHQHVLSTTHYGDLAYCSSVQKDNIFATQFHPEKSGKVGLAILEKWLKSFV